MTNNQSDEESSIQHQITQGKLTKKNDFIRYIILNKYFH